MLTSLQVGERRVWDFGFRVAVRAKGSSEVLTWKLCGGLLLRSLNVQCYDFGGVV